MNTFFDDFSQTPALLSLKRKRDDTDENEKADESKQHEAVDIVVDNVIDLTGNDNNDKDIVLDDEEDLLVVPLTKAEFLESGTRTNNRQLDGPPPRKRTRRIASVLAQTATAVTIGAVVTWSALAFS